MLIFSNLSDCIFMKVFDNTDFLEDGTEYVATIGFFDGVHLGHQYLIENLKTIAAQQGRQSMVITFTVHPRVVLHSDFTPALLTTNDEKLKHLVESGVSACVMLDFSLEMSLLSAQEFIRDILFERYKVRTLLIGYDHRFGHNRSEGFHDYVRYGEQIGVSVIEAAQFSLPHNVHISSSQIRMVLQQGHVSKAASMLGYSYSLQGLVEGGFKVGRKIGFPTANIRPLHPDKLIPAMAVYAVVVNLDGEFYKGMMNIGVRPTLGNGAETSLEVNIFDFAEDIYNQEIEVCFIDRIRSEQKFDSLEALTAQLAQDKAMAIRILDDALSEK
jgi:riboflavin kinase/FMN adenylyltransferase